MTDGRDGDGGVFIGHPGAHSGVPLRGFAILISQLEFVQRRLVCAQVLCPKAEEAEETPKTTIAVQEAPQPSSSGSPLRLSPPVPTQPPSLLAELPGHSLPKEKPDAGFLSPLNISTYSDYGEHLAWCPRGSRSRVDEWVGIAGAKMMNLSTASSIAEATECGASASTNSDDDVLPLLPDGLALGTRATGSTFATFAIFPVAYNLGLLQTWAGAWRARSATSAPWSSTGGSGWGWSWRGGAGRGTTTGAWTASPTSPARPTRGSSSPSTTSLPPPSPTSLLPHPRLHPVFLPHPRAQKVRLRLICDFLGRASFSAVRSPVARSISSFLPLPQNPSHSNANIVIAFKSSLGQWLCTRSSYGVQ